MNDRIHAPQSLTLTLCETGPTSLPTHESWSPFCLKVHRALRVSGLAYSRRAGRPDSFRALNPTGQVPVLLVGDQPIADSTAILRALPALCGRAPWQADDAEAWLWEELADTSLYGFVVAARWADDDNWPRVRAAYFEGVPWFFSRLIPAKIRRHVLSTLVARDVTRAGLDACWARLDTLLDQLNVRAPRTGYWRGETPGVADLGLFAQLWSLRTPLTPRQARMVESRPRLLAYLDRMHAATANTHSAASQVFPPNHGPTVASSGAPCCV